MRTLPVVIVTLSLIVGCLDEPDSVGTAEQSIGATGRMPGRCPDPDDCTESNGGGVYTQELGHAHFGSHDAMITTFARGSDANGAPVLSYLARYKNWLNSYVYVAGSFDHAYYNGAYYAVVADLTESLSAPTFTLRNGTTTTTVGPDNLFKLQLVTKTLDETNTLSFGPRINEVVQVGTLQNYRMYWNTGDGVGSSTLHDYCQQALQSGQVEADRFPDTAVFQQGITVSPLNARGDFGQGTAVTLSCRLGAVATSRGWGYVYRNNDPQQLLAFAAAMHMKRASYCGDITFFTRRNTPIIIKDFLPTPIMNNPINATNIEAAWGRSTAPDGLIRALCVNWVAPHDTRRHPHVDYPPASNDEFDGNCYYPNGSVAFSIPTCDSSSFPNAIMWSAKAPSTP